MDPENFLGRNVPCVTLLRARTGVASRENRVSTIQWVKREVAVAQSEASIFRGCSGGLQLHR